MVGAGFGLIGLFGPDGAFLGAIVFLLFFLVPVGWLVYRRIWRWRRFRNL